MVLCVCSVLIHVTRKIKIRYCEIKIPVKWSICVHLYTHIFINSAYLINLQKALKHCRFAHWIAEVFRTVFFFFFIYLVFRSTKYEYLIVYFRTDLPHIVRHNWVFRHSLFSLIAYCFESEPFHIATKIRILNNNNKIEGETTKKKIEFHIKHRQESTPVK